MIIVSTKPMAYISEQVYELRFEPLSNGYFTNVHVHSFPQVVVKNTKRENHIQNNSAFKKKCVQMCSNNKLGSAGVNNSVKRGR